MLDPTVKRLIISAMTRYGKTLFVAIGLLILIANTPLKLNPNTRKIIIIAPTRDQTKILRGYINDCIQKNDGLYALLDKPLKTTKKKLKAEMNKQRITFANGWEIITLTAHAGKNDPDPAPGLMGQGGDIIVIDEACLIRQAVYDKRISRMLGDDAANSRLIIIVNPWDKRNFAYDAWCSPAFVRLHIPWQQALSEGRTTREFLMEQKNSLTPYSWTVLYESEFADQTEDTLIPDSWIHRATAHRQLMGARIWSNYGLDVAEAGANKTVLTHVQTNGNLYVVVGQTWIRPVETVPAAEDVMHRIPNRSVNINVDAIGIGAGVYSYLKEKGYSTSKIIVSEGFNSSDSEKLQFRNKKAMYWWHLRTLFEKELIQIPNDPNLKKQLASLTYNLDLGKIMVEKPAGVDSPDYAESLMLACIPQIKRKTPIIGQIT